MGSSHGEEPWKETRIIVITNIIIIIKHTTLQTYYYYYRCVFLLLLFSRKKKRSLSFLLLISVKCFLLLQLRECVWVRANASYPRHLSSLTRVLRKLPLFLHIINALCRERYVKSKFDRGSATEKDRRKLNVRGNTVSFNDTWNNFETKR